MDEEKKPVIPEGIFTAKAGFLGGVLATLFALKVVHVAQKVLK